MKLPQLTLRDLFWLVLAAALVCAWYVERASRLQSEARAAAAQERADKAEATSADQAQQLQQLRQAVFQAGFIVDERQDTLTKRMDQPALVPRDESPLDGLR